MLNDAAAPVKITPGYFRTATGREPKDDDMDRVNCEKAGQITHWCCGWCDRHNLPMFDCMCFTKAQNLKGKI